jgi:hypothetical protein
LRGAVSYALDNAMFQWSGGEARLREAEPLEQADLERAAAAVGDELRRRLGSSFELEELIALYASGTEWADHVASRNRAGSDTGAVVDAAFGRYAREAADFAGGRVRHRERKEA